MSKIISIYLTDDTLELLDDIAKEESRSRSNLVRKLLIDYNKQKNGD